MPELPEVETIVRGLRRRIRGKVISGIRILFPGIIEAVSPLQADTLIDAHIEDIERRGKIILMYLTGGRILLVHLGMTGKLIFISSDRPLEKHTHLILELGPRKAVHLRYVDIRRFGRVLLMERSSAYRYIEQKKLGSEPLVIDEKSFTDLLVKRRGSIKALLLSQSLVCGIGNIYTDEILYRAHIHPEREAAGLSLPERTELYHSMVAVLTEAIRKKGSTISDYLDPEGNSGDFQNHHRVYARQGRPCNGCGTVIAKKTVAGRGTHFCPCCQPLE